jgi:hypothetical protein
LGFTPAPFVHPTALTETAIPERSSDPSSQVSWLFVAVLTLSVVGYPLVAGLPIILGAPSRTVTVPFRMAVALAAVLLIGRAIAHGRAYRGIMWFPLAAFWALYTARILLDTTIAPVTLGTPPMEYLLYAFGICLIPALAVTETPGSATLERSLRAITILGAVAIIANIVAGIHEVLSGNLSVISGGRFITETINPISMGHLGTTVITLSAFQLIRPRRDGEKSRAWLLITLLLGAISIGISAANGPMLALAVTGSFLLLMDWRAGHYGRVVTVLLAIPIAAWQAAEFFQRHGFNVISRAQAALDDTPRFRLFQGAVDQYLSHPLFGSSVVERVSLTYPHNVLLEGFMAVGFLGGVLFILFFVPAVGKALRLSASGSDAMWMGLLALQYSLGALTSGALFGSPEMWIFLMAVIACTAQQPDVIGAPRFALAEAT